MKKLLCFVLVFSLLPTLLHAKKKSKELSGDVEINGTTYKTLSEISPEPGTKYYRAKDGEYCDGLFAIHIPSSYDHKTPMPLVMSSHGAKLNGVTEVAGWKKQAENHGFIVVCPSFGIAASLIWKGETKITDKMVCDIMKRIKASLKIDKNNVLGTGFSGGGNPAFYVMMKHPKLFTAFCFRGANYVGRGIQKSSKWKKAPIYIFWGENDHPMITGNSKDFSKGQGPEALKALLKMKKLSKAWKKRDDKNSFVSSDGTFKWEVVPNGKHDSRPDLVAAWFAEQFKK